MHRQTVPACGRRSRCKSPSHILIASAQEPTSFTAVKLTAARTFQVALFAGAFAGLTVDAVLFPLDTLKTRMQLATTASSTSASAARVPLFKGLYQGFGPAVAASAPAAAAFFAVYDYTKRILQPLDKDGRYAPLCHIAAAAAGDVSGSTVRVPFEVVKQRMQSGMFSTTGAAIRGTFAREGVAGFFAGYGSLILRELPFDAIQFPLYEYFKMKWAKETNVRELETWQNAICGSMAGAVAAVVTTPLDVVKTRLMTQSAAAPKYHGILHGLRTVAKEEGPRALMSGVTPRTVWISLGGAVFFGAYEAAKKALYPTFAKAQLEEESKREYRSPAD